MKVWLVFSGDYEARGTIGPAFSNESAAQLFAGKDDEVCEYEVFDGTPTQLTHYQCYGWLKDPRETCHELHRDIFMGVREFGGYWIDEKHWSSWDVLVPDPPMVKVSAYSGKGPLNFADADGRDCEAVRSAVVEALAKL